MRTGSLKQRVGIASAANCRYVNCSLCGRQIDINNAFLVVTKNKKEFYCSKEEYEGGQEYVAKRTSLELSLEYDVRDIVGGPVFDADLFRDLREKWLRYAQIEIVCAFVHQKKEEYTNIIQRKGIDGAASRLRYLSAIIINNIVKSNRFVAPDNLSSVELNSAIDYTMYAPKMEPRKSIRRSLSDLEDSYEPKK